MKKTTPITNLERTLRAAPETGDGQSCAAAREPERPAPEKCFGCGKTHGTDDHCENDDLIFFDESPEVLRKGFNK